MLNMVNSNNPFHLFFGASSPLPPPLLPLTSPLTYAFGLIYPLSVTSKLKVFIVQTPYPSYPTPPHCCAWHQSQTDANLRYHLSVISLLRTMSRRRRTPTGRRWCWMARRCRSTFWTRLDRRTTLPSGEQWEGDGKSTSSLGSCRPLKVIQEASHSVYVA